MRFPLEGFLRARLRHTTRLAELLLLRTTETIFVTNVQGLGETTEVALERLLDTNTLLRWASSATASEKISGIEWGTELAAIRRLSPRSALSVGGGVYGDTSRQTVQTYRLLARYRRNFLRSWLFYDGEPEVAWLRQSDGSFRRIFAFTARIEVAFSCRAGKDAPPPAQ